MPECATLFRPRLGAAYYPSSAAMTSTSRRAASIAARATSADARARVGLIIGYGFEVVGAAKEGAKLGVETRLILGQPPQLVLNAAMALDDPAGTLDDYRLRRMQSREICRTPGFVGPIVGKHVLRLQKKFASLLQEGRGFGTHKSMPSERTESISGVRSS